MHEPQHHDMQLEATHPSGMEEWHCPTCGRRFLMQWPPEYQKVVLQPGDEYAIHRAGKGGVQIGPPAIGKAQEPPLSEELRAALEEALKNADLDK